MTNQERWDVAVKVLNGPLSAMGEQVLRGPVVRLGANPGPGGVQLTGYRGLDARQCVITAYKGGSAAVAPVGTNQVRVAPHANVNWKEIDPIPGPVYLTDGCAIHLGPVGRGATIEFVECRRFGTWEHGRLASEIAQVSSAGTPAAQIAKGGVPKSFDARKVGMVRASTAPIWFLGCMFVLMSTTAVTLVLIGGYQLAFRDVASLGPEEEGYEFYESVDLAKTELDLDLYKGLEKPFFEFVMRYNQEAAGSAQKGLDKPANWDSRFLQYTTAQIQQQVRAWSVFRTLDQVRKEYSDVTLVLREAGLPEVFAGIPYQESRYRPRMQSVVCAMGYWQFMPEVALRVERKSGSPFRVRDCRLKGVSDFKWNPTELAPPLPVSKAEYVFDDDGERRCLIDSCDIDDRTDLKKSTKAAVFALAEAFNDKKLRRSGSIVQITILSHNAGYDDRRFGRKSRSNLKPAYEAWSGEYGETEGPYFYGRNILTATHSDKAWNGSKLPPETQHYGYSVVAQHLLAVCYYASNYPEDRAFSAWRHHVSDADGYCRQFDVPSSSDVRRRKGGAK
ncbi:MAG: hypothetical protein ACI8PZ_001505 [Myxococcota bacterium]